MITLYKFGPAFGLLDSSPFVAKAEMLLKMAGLPYQTNRFGYTKAPKGKLPFIDDDGKIVADSTFIRWHIETKYGVDFDRGLSEAERAMAWSVEKLLEDHLYWILLQWRWLDDTNYARAVDVLFGKLPWPVRTAIGAMVRRKMRKAVHAQGAGRHSHQEQLRLAKKALMSVSAILGDKPYLMGSQPCGADATLFAFVAAVFCPQFETPLLQEAARMPNLIAYIDRMRSQYLESDLKAAA